MSNGQAIQGQYGGVGLSNVGMRLGAFLLDVLLAIVTLFIGWLIWSLIIWGRGQTPGKQLLNMRVVKKDTGQAASWGTMFLREIPCKFIIGLVASITIFIVYLWPLWDKENQELWDKMVDTVVVDDPDGVLDPRNAGAGQAASLAAGAAIPQAAPEQPVATPVPDAPKGPEAPSGPQSPQGPQSPA